MTADPNAHVCAGFEILRMQFHQQRDLNPTIERFEHIGTPYARGLALYARGNEAMKVGAKDWGTLLERADHLLEGEDAWAQAAVNRMLANVGRGRREDCDARVAKADRLAPFSSLIPDLTLATLWQAIPDVDLEALHCRLQQTGPRRTASRVQIGLAMRTMVRDGLEAAEPRLRAVVEDPHISKAQVAIPRLNLVFAMLLRRAPSIEEHVRQLSPNSLIERDWSEMARCWFQAQQGQHSTAYAPRLDGLLVRAQRAGIPLSILVLIEGLRRDAPDLGERLDALRGHALITAGRPLDILPAARVPIGPWDVLEPLSAGAQGAVWTAERRHSKETAVVKWLPPDSARAQRLEIRALGGLDHPHVMQIHDVLVADRVTEVQSNGRIAAGSVGLVMPRARGSLLLAPPPPKCVRPVLQALLEALAHVHARGLLHLDIKESNVLYNDPEAAHLGVWLTDFGVANAGWGVENDGLAGTPGYMAPEQQRGQLGQLGPWSDLYALGRMAQKWVAGAAWAAWLDSLLQPDPRDRVSSALEALRTLPGVVPAHIGSEPTAGGSGGTTFLLDSAAPQVSVAAPAPEPHTLPHRLPTAPSRRTTGWTGLLAWRHPPWIERGPELDNIWNHFVQVADRSECEVLRISGAGHGRRRLLAEVAERAMLTGACITRSVDLAHSTDIFNAMQDGVNRTPLAGVIRRVLEQTTDAQEALTRIAEATLGFSSPALVVMHSKRLNIPLDGPLLTLNGQPGRILMVVEDEAGTPLPPMPLACMALLGQRLAGLEEGAAEDLARSREGCPGWLVATLSVLERNCQLTGPLGGRTVIGRWPVSRMDTLRADLALCPDPKAALDALLALHRDETANAEAVALLRAKGLVRVIRGRPVPVDTWYLQPSAVDA